MVMSFLHTGFLKYLNTTQSTAPLVKGSTHNILKKDYELALKTNLKQLEFISRLEMHLDNSLTHIYSLKFLQELNNIKAQAQNKTIQSIKYCK
ncbi:MAG: hypothetical protein BM549_10455 [Lacinutrix sp. MedPE-SW]|nr:MAG: hypothetical protein BM549_10455 [Lacinutrix sp. MedPE-SW]